MIMSTVELEGLAYLSFFDDGSWFQVMFCFIPVTFAIRGVSLSNGQVPYKYLLELLAKIRRVLSRLLVLAKFLQLLACSDFR